MTHIRTTDELNDAMLSNVAGGAVKTALATQEASLRKHDAALTAAADTMLVARPVAVGY